jgi:hypothetical protein
MKLSINGVLFEPSEQGKEEDDLDTIKLEALTLKEGD